MTLPQLPELPVNIFKDGDTAGTVWVQQPDGTETVLEFAGNLPFSRLRSVDWEPFSGPAGVPDSDRLAFLRDCLAEFLRATPKAALPTRFRTLNGREWKIDRKVLRGLLGAGWETVAEAGIPDARIRQRR